jgi:hypothetical protein
MIDINYDKAVELIGRAVAERGEDYVYPYVSCQNVLKAGEFYGLRETFEANWRRGATQVPEDQPGCIVGLAMSYVLPLEQINIGGGIVTMRSTLHQEGLARFSTKAVNFLADAQGYQDNGYAWGVAMREAIKASASPYNGASDEIDYPFAPYDE